MEQKSFRTSAGVGPCSTIAELKSAYGNALEPSPNNTIDGKVYAYTVGHLVFSANGAPPHPSTRVTSVAIYTRDPARLGDVHGDCTSRTAISSELSALYVSRASR